MPILVRANGSLFLKQLNNKRARKRKICALQCLYRHRAGLTLSQLKNGFGKVIQEIHEWGS
jgi:hypothetical protein